MIILNEFEQQVIEEINSIKWEEYQGPEYYTPKSVISSLKNLVRIRDEKEKWNICNDVLFAVGNNHAGTYYPAIIKTLPLLIKLTKYSDHEIVRNCVFEIISDLYYSFNSELGTYSKTTASDLETFVRTTIKKTIQNTIWEESERNKKLIKDFFEYLSEEAST